MEGLGTSRSDRKEYVLKSGGSYEVLDGEEHRSGDRGSVGSGCAAIEASSGPDGGSPTGMRRDSGGYAREGHPGEGRSRTARGGMAVRG